MGKYFGTDGFRGEAGVSLTADHAFKIGRFLGWYYNELRRRAGETAAARIVIGKDTRRSSYMFEYSLVGGLVASFWTGFPNWNTEDMIPPASQCVTGKRISRSLRRRAV